MDFLSVVLTSLTLSIGIVILFAFLKSLGDLGEKILRELSYFLFF